MSGVLTKLFTPSLRMTIGDACHKLTDELMTDNVAVQRQQRDR